MALNNEYLLDTANAMVESHQSEEKVTTFSIVENPKATKYKYELYIYDNARSNDASDCLNLADVHYSQCANEICAICLREIVELGSGSEMKILVNLPDFGGFWAISQTVLFYRVWLNI